MLKIEEYILDGWMNKLCKYIECEIAFLFLILFIND